MQCMHFSHHPPCRLHLYKLLETGHMCGLCRRASCNCKAPRCIPQEPAAASCFALSKMDAEPSATTAHLLPGPPSVALQASGARANNHMFYNVAAKAINPSQVRARTCHSGYRLQVTGTFRRCLVMQRASAAGVKAQSATAQCVPFVTVVPCFAAARCLG